MFLHTLPQLPPCHLLLPLSLAHFAPATQVSSLFLQHATLILTSGPLHVLCPPPGMPFPWLWNNSFLICHSGLIPNVTSSERPALATQGKLSSPTRIWFCFLHINSLLSKSSLLVYWFIVSPSSPLDCLVCPAPASVPGTS